MIFSKLLAFGTASVVAFKTVYTTPAGHTAILKSINLTSNGATAMRGEISLWSPSGTAALISSLNLTQYVAVERATWVVVPAGWSLRVNMSLAQPMAYILSGSELLGEPPTPTVPTFLEATQLPAPGLPPHVIPI